MKKLIVVIVIVLVGAVGWAGATYVIGGKAERECNKIVERYQHWGPMTLRLESYQRGFLTSRARTVVTITVPKAGKENGAAAGQEKQPETVQVVFDHTVHNGPFPGGSGAGLAVIETRLVDVSPGHEEFEKLRKQFPWLQDPLMVSTIAFDGTEHNRMDIPVLESQIDGEQIHWGGLTIDATFSPRRKTLAGTFSMPGLDVHGDDGTLTWDGANGKIAMTEALPLVYVGTSEAQIGPLKMDMAEKKGAGRVTFEMKGLGVSSSSSCKDGLVQGGQKMAFAGLTMDGKTYGPGALEVEVKNLDGVALGAFQQQVRELYRDPQSTRPEELMGRLLPLYGQLLTKLAAGKPQLNIRRLHFVTPVGDVDGSLLISFDGGPGVDLHNPLVLLQGLEAQADLAVNEKLVKLMVADRAEAGLKTARKAGRLPAYSDEQIAALAEKQAGDQLEAVLAQNLAVRDGERIKTSATFHAGKLVVNGQSLPLFR
jgi:uncharacterized protein YdgA (DUF945 family)